MSAVGTVGVIGGGAWGTALASVAARAGRPVRLWARDVKTVEDINRHHENRMRLPGVALDAGIVATRSLEETCAADVLILAVPAQAVRGVAQEMAGVLPAGRPVVIAAKGIERGTEAFMSDVVAEALPQAVPAVLSGPSFADDVAHGLPTAVTLACADEAVGRTLVEAIGYSAFRPYRSSDLTGVQVGGAVKNVLAIACGVVVGKALGASAHAALVARGFAELTRFGRALGARPETLSGLSGLGDLVLTATSPQSRNYSFGVSLGRGDTVDTILGGRKAVTEGVWTAPAVVDRAAKLDVEMPICAAVAAVVAGRASVDTAIEALLSRPFREEH
ncbi:NAD(P)H-dependent glycerol-3-phosphate dehydrogenase [Microbaculum marinisediminis]|uniref:Glycerol-3-phosphate dehydrogenase [NAD(P)+] n=1 Tax=Microbaculum marinisediminis TaxID=2931392 RepID=A0AAW5R0Y8_9HYPH|nr:NAD(P)H-dependent glycerol-3-phosphate dehydrogenase [Microbaculum sp. A6E488]MCT8972361.1 NAD(P)-dependent glycerol-3-phosphate dehydrogenase [Microbaculum sp. A6E488]